MQIKPCPSATNDLCEKMFAAMGGKISGSNPALPPPPYFHKWDKFTRWISSMELDLQTGPVESLTAILLASLDNCVFDVVTILGLSSQTYLVTTIKSLKKTSTMPGEYSENAISEREKIDDFLIALRSLLKTAFPGVYRHGLNSTTNIRKWHEKCQSLA